MQVERFNNEVTYQITMIHAKSLLKKGVVTESEFNHFKQLMMSKYQPFISKLSC
ncbi:hypothetical protein RYR35_001129 [Streptococcus iniae]|uniref:SHOCT domain-containing protein n=1 Tax=Streptococcus iniae TaxID=1346 RepID=UPI001604C183|nr:SHOCT domain-containing protein [Streptococcus iniae]ELY5747896.1 hypothetical protein [Streptococcus iniae]